jgi:ribosomal protein S18 acetylase RimI-like enzyme
VLEACRRHGGVLVAEGAAAAWLPGALVPLPWSTQLRAGFAWLPLALPPAALLRLQHHESACEKAIRARFASQRFAYLWLIGVVPKSREQGAGRKLLDAVLQGMAGEFDLCVLKTENPGAGDFYRKVGFGLQDRFVVPTSRLDVQVFARSV